MLTSPREDVQDLRSLELQSLFIYKLAKEFEDSTKDNKKEVLKTLKPTFDEFQKGLQKYQEELDNV